MRKPLILLWAAVLVAVSAANNLNADNDIIFDEAPTRESELPFYRRILNRVKRDWNFFDFGSSDESTTTEAPASEGTSPSEEETPTTPTATSRETRSPDEPFIRPSIYNDDEDEDRDTSGSGEPGDIPSEFPPDDNSKTIYRITLEIEQPWTEEFAIITSPKFKEFADSIQKDIDALYEKIPGHQLSEVIKIEKKDPFTAHVTVDIVSVGNSNGEQIADQIRSIIRTKNRIGSHIIKNEGFTFVNFKACSYDELRCDKSNICVPLSSRCDGTLDCPDGEDEEGCASNWNKSDLGFSAKPAPEETTSKIFEVKSGIEGPYHHICRGDTAANHPCNNTEGPEEYVCTEDICDGENDCKNGHDEENCSKYPPCTDDEFKCTDEIGRCIPLASRCDGTNNCEGGSDEENCPACMETEFSCDTTRCIPKAQYCNGVKDCADGTDEEKCTVCTPEDIRCKDGTCVSYMKKCDFVRDCPEGEDEEFCLCPSDYFLCDGHCYPESKRCDGTKDCHSGIDEANCQNICNDNEWQCDNGDCIYKIQRCDTHVDCLDQSDENNCPCPSDWFMCHNQAKCIPMIRKCDGTHDCNDLSDEIGCSEACPDSKIKCPSGEGCYNPSIDICNKVYDCPDGSDETNCICNEARGEFACPGTNQCISQAQRCNNHTDCLDGADERDCPSNCLPNEFRCDNGVCINGEFHCDQLQDCTDGSDEKDCTQRSCDPSDFLCKDGSCIRSSLKCDGKVDCRDGSDESQETCTRGCGSHEFQCNDGSCIPLIYKCDSTRHCPDNSDEIDCPVTPKPFITCQPDEFTCSDRLHCIPLNEVCNYRRDCPDGSDEENCVKPPCQPNEFECRGGECIPLDRKCDNYPNCPDGSDEEQCGFEPGSDGTPKLIIYPSDQIIKESREAVFQCRDEGASRYKVKWYREQGLPLPPGSRTEHGRLEIPNVQTEHSGTYYCEAIGVSSSTPGARISAHLTVEELVFPTQHPLGCRQNEAKCLNGECIQRHLVCDGKRDCRDGSDEINCHTKCEPNEFHCRNGKCVFKTWVCDKEDDCGDNTDEEDCSPGRNGTNCYHSDLECSSRNQWVPSSYQCDGQNDCQDGSDERGCYPMECKKMPEPMVRIYKGETLTLYCEGGGVPIPHISWRKDWGHVPEKCTQTQDCTTGIGVLTCPDMEIRDSGAYTCELMTTRGYKICPRDSIVEVIPTDTRTCPPGFFRDPESNECTKCFCFGISTECSSADLYVYQIPAPIRLSLVNVHITPSTVDVSHNLPNRTLIGFTASSRLDIDNEVGNVYPYFSLPETYHGNQLTSYGGFLTYSILFDSQGGGIDSKIPDIIIKGNGQTLLYRHPQTIPSNVVTTVSAQIKDNGHWFILNQRREEVRARREDIMMTLVAIDYILIRIHYTNDDGAKTTISNVVVDSARHSNAGLGKAGLVEMCRCPPGYKGLSCEKCEPTYTRTPPPPYLGECKQIPDCQRGYYGDPANKLGHGSIPCQRCPCPLAYSPYRVTDDCYLFFDQYNQPNPRCVCPRGYEGDRCERCETGYVGNPLVGIPCTPELKPICNRNGSKTDNPPCACKALVTGQYCTECKTNAFHLSSKNQYGCISCFCMGITKECQSSRLYRSQIVTNFARDDQGFKLAPEDDPSNTVPIQVEQGSISYDNFQPKVYYWSLPSQFLGNQLRSYGGQLQYTVRYVPSPGGERSINNAADVKLFSKNRVNLYYHHNNTSLMPHQEQKFNVILMEQYWKREDGGNTDRENFLMALENLEYIYIKATYTTSTQYASLRSVILDTAVDQYTGQDKALEVEECQCPTGYEGLSCEHCAPGYKRGNEGIYLGICEPCECNGRSRSCDPETGVCTNCEYNYAGDHCEACRPGYEEVNGRCIPRDVRPCNCDPRGMTSCNSDGSCNCKVNVEGASCDRCIDGTFNISADNIRGCSDCYCSDATKRCQSSNLFYQQYPMPILDNNHGLILTDRYSQNVIRDGFQINPSKNEIGYDLQSSNNNLYWSLPPQFTGDKITSYEGNLIYSQRILFNGRANIQPDYDVIINGNGKSIYWENFNPSSENYELIQTVTVPLKEGFWRNADPRYGHAIVTKREILEVLSSITSILIRASFGPDAISSYLSDVTLDVAIPYGSGGRPALGVEFCQCPPGHKGTSCQQCVDHYYKTYTNICERCNCSGNEESCSLGPNNQLLCKCKDGYSGRWCQDRTLKCPDHYFQNQYDVCEPCSCNGHEVKCYLGSDYQQHCICKGGFTGSKCEENSGTMVHLAPAGDISRISGELNFTCDFESHDDVNGRIDIYEIGREPITIITASSDPYTHKGKIEHVFVQVTPDLEKVECRVFNLLGKEVGSSIAYIVDTSPSPSPPVPIIIMTIEDDQPSIQIKAVGSSVRYTCAATGPGGNAKLEWSRSGGALPSRARDDRQGHLEIVNLRVDDSGTYICTATDEYSRYLTSRFVTLTVGASPPRVQITPSDVRVAEGEPVNINCDSPSSPLNYLQWRRVGANLNPNIQIRGGNLYIPSISKSDEGEYECIGRNDGGTSTGRVTVYVSGVPNVPYYIQPSSTNTSPGQPVTLYCGGSTSGERVDWRREDGQRVNGIQRGNVLEFTTVSQEDAGIYLCIIYNRNGQPIGQARASITIASFPVDRPHRPFTIDPQHQTVKQGHAAEFVCNVPFDNYSGERNVRWYKSTGDLSPRAQFLEYGRKLMIPDLRFEDRGIYVCYFPHNGRAYNISASLEVERWEKPRIELYPNDQRQILSVGNSLLLQCRVEGIPIPTIRWSRTDNTPFPEHIIDSNTGVLRFNQVRLQDSGTYVCTAENDVGSDHARVEVEVQEPPKITIRPSDSINLQAGQNLDLTCIAEGSPLPEVIWTKQDPYGPDVYHGASPSRGRAEYLVYQVSQEDEGVYYCVAKNAANTEVRAVQVTVDRVEPPIYTPSAPSENSTPSRFMLASGDDSRISCAEGNRELHVTWGRLDGREFPLGVSQRDGVLIIQAATRAAEGEYVCTVYDEYQNVVKRLHQIIIIKEVPHIILEPPTQIVRPGDNAEIICKATGDTPIQITWESTDPLPSNVRILDGLLSFTGITERNAGKYICKARNDAGFREAVAEVIVNSYEQHPTRVRIQGEKLRNTIQGNTITLNCTSDIPRPISWTWNHRAVPPEASASGGYLVIQNIQPSHSGRYQCNVQTPSGQLASDYIDLRVSRDRTCHGDFICSSGECISPIHRCDNALNCGDGSDEIGCPRRRRGAPYIRLKIEPSIDIITVGSTVDLRCTTVGIPSSSLEWTKLTKTGAPEPELGPNVQVISANLLRIMDVTTSNAGTYRCSAQAETGRYTDDYTLKVQDNSLSDSTPPQIVAAKKIILKVGQTADLTCTNDLEPPVSYNWLRQEGLPSTATTNEDTLTLNKVSLKDSGLYTCVATNGEVKMEIPKFVVIQGTIPSFDSQSYIKLKTMFDAYMQFDIEILFKPEDSNGLILYNGRQSSFIGVTDFVSFGLRNGYPEFKFDMGSGHATILGKFPLPLGKWAKAKLNRNRKEGRLVINDEEPVIGTSQGRHQGLDLDLPLYVGSVPDFNEISKSADFTTGFKGCISRLVIKNEEQNLTRAGALDWVGISECETCADNECTNSGACQEAPNTRGYVCLCPKGFSGENCDRMGESCYPGLCGDGYCENTERGYVCKCPLGLAGSTCEHRIKIRTPSFDDTSYIAYSAPRNTEKMEITLKINPSDSQDALILYAAQNDFGTGNYISIAVKDRRLEFRIETGAGSPVVLKSNTEIIPGSWMTVTAGRDLREAWLSIGHDMARTTLTAAQRRELLLGTFLYLGGFDTSTGSVNTNVGVTRGFRGCISHIDISRMDIDVLRSAKESSNVGECPSGNPCRDNPCRHGATCIPDGSVYSCVCTSDYIGVHCEKLKNDCERYEPCGGKGECVPLANGYKCHCTKGFSGQNCTIREFFTTSFSIEGDGWVELPKALADEGDDTEVELNIVTDSPNGILMWHGQGPATAGGVSDFFSIAVINGAVEVVFELGSGLGHIVSDVRVNDGSPHRVIVSRRGNYATLTVDGKTIEGQSEGFLSKLNANGNIYIGGVPDPMYMTNGRYSENFNGCIRNIRIQNSDIIDVSNTAVSTVNLRRCPVSP